MMEPKLIEANGDDFIVHFTNEGSPDYKMRWSGTVAEIQKFNDGIWEYRSNESSGFVADLKDARVWFEFSYCWRGVWEGRIYFKDSEYWCEEMKTMPAIWAQIEAIMKERIKLDNPDYGYFDE